MIVSGMLKLCSYKLTLCSLVVCLCDCCVEVKMSLQLYQVDQKSFLLDFKSLNTQDHPDAARVKRMTRASMSMTSDSGDNSSNYTVANCRVSCHSYCCWSL